MVSEIVIKDRVHLNRLANCTCVATGMYSTGSISILSNRYVTSIFITLNLVRVWVEEGKNFFELIEMLVRLIMFDLIELMQDGF